MEKNVSLSRFTFTKPYFFVLHKDNFLVPVDGYLTGVHTICRLVYHATN